MSKHLEYQEADGIHHFIWKSANRRSVDIWMQWMSYIKIRNGKIDYIMLDFSEISLPPVRHLSQQVRHWLTQNPAQKRGCVVAVIYSSGNMPFLIVARSYKTTLSRGRPVKLQFFSSDQKEAAYDWFQKHKDSNAPMG